MLIAQLSASTVS